MSLFADLNGSLVGTTYIRLGGIGGLPAAADGTGSQGGIVFDDPLGNLTVTGWQIIKVTEPDCTAAPVLFYGTVADRTYRRGPYLQGPSREIDTTINDHNGFLSLRLLGGNGPSRPQETDRARIAWLLSDASLDGLVYDLGFVNGTGLKFDAANFQGMYPADVLNDIASHYGQIFFTYWDQVQGKVGLFFDFPTAVTFTSSLSISNVLSDVDDVTVFEPYKDAELVADPSEVYSRVRFVYTGGVVWRSDSTTAATFFPEPLRYRSLQVENDRIGKLTTATTFANRVLAADSTEREMVSFTVRLPSTKVGLIQAGMRIHLRFTHLPGFETGTYSRIERLTYLPTDADQTHYDVHCECSTHGLTTAIGSGGGSTDPFPYQPPDTTPSVIQQVSGDGNIMLPFPVGSDTTLVWAGAARSDHIQDVAGWDYLSQGWIVGPDGEVDNTGPNVVVILYKHTDGTQSQYLNGAPGAISLINGTLYEVSGVLTPGNHNSHTGVGFTITSNSIVAPVGFNVGVGAQGVGGGYDTVANAVTYTIGSGWTKDLDHFTIGGHPTVVTGHRFDAATYAFTATNDLPSGDAWIGQIVSFTGTVTSVDPPPSAKKWGPIIPDESPNAVIVDFTVTGYTWAPGSLQVFVNKLDQTAAVIAQDGLCGTFTLGFAPWTGDLIEVYGITP